MSNNDKPRQNAVYAVRTKCDEHGRPYAQICVPSKRGRAWIPIPHEHETALRQQPECWAEFVDPAQKPGWKVALLDELYQEFRHGENARKRQDFSYDSWEALPEDGQAIHVSFVQQEETNARYEQMLSLISTEKTRQRLRLFVDGWLFVEIAQLENPGASQEQLETAQTRSTPRLTGH